MPTALPARNFAAEDFKTVSLADILREFQGLTPMHLLVVGCGSGREAAALAQHYGIKVTGIDIAPHFDPDAVRVADLRQGDATRMEFEDGSFDFVYSFHVLEHIPDYRAALSEIRRVLKPGGGYMIATPNRDRLLGYMGSVGTPLTDKLRWNLTDWSAMLRGRFRNEYGAHAGYTAEELAQELGSTFSTVIDITARYYYRVYSSKKMLVSALLRTGAWRWFFPAVYFYGVR